MNTSEKKKMRLNMWENEIISKIESINLKEVKEASASMNNYTNFISLKLKKSREGIIYSIHRKKHLEDVTKKLNKELLEGNKELQKLEKGIKKLDKDNSNVQNNIITEMNKNNAYKSRLFILKKNKIRITKAQDIIDKDINYMQTRINMMKENVDENSKKYYKLVNNNDKMHKEMERFKKDRRNLQLHLKNTKRNHQVLKNKMQNFVLNLKNSKTKGEDNNL
ncbi:conserved Plasmodium protein, unknown function [Plasmodium ovale wallikeri]|uniref:Uncharacterized protein n=2 Tax=Plasmodium ovale TaxID=36330 RepID=A0A1A8YI07_PLAOA|nr:conserved Plasmodium protein, unknown function [Plasmodium ovale wallikeri]SBT31764.1 conserved Plasmodium protein, unknown function [Plasmodium ovale wallikeri]SBT75475.1 conserved Plasmodium protein, unknown function [Plasmodium ovale]